MPRDLFGDVTRPSISIGNRKRYTVPVSLFTHSVVVLALVAIPLFATDVVPQPWQKTRVVFPAAPEPPDAPPPPEPEPPIQITDEIPQPGISIVAPDGIHDEPPEPIEPHGPDISEHIVRGIRDVDVLVAPPPAPKPEPQQPLRVGGAIRQPQKVREVAPVYPTFAQAARVQGIVIIEATIGADGRVENARILRSVPLLDEAALEAVRQWEYTPSLLNGVPVPVIMTVTVTFTLSK